MEFKTYDEAVADGSIFVWGGSADKLAKKERFDANTKFTIDNQDALKSAVENLVQQNQVSIQANLNKITEIAGEVGITLGEANSTTSSLSDEVNTIKEEYFKNDGSNAIVGDIVPDVANAYTLGSPDKPFKDLFIGQNSLYVNGQKVLSEDSGTIVISADDDQNVQLRTGGAGDIEFYPSGDGIIQLKGAVQIPSTKSLMTNDNEPLQIGNSIVVDGSINGVVIENIGSLIALKADTTTVNSALALKADTTTVNSALDLKADTTTVNSALDLKADITTVENIGSLTDFNTSFTASK